MLILSHPTDESRSLAEGHKPGEPAFIETYDASGGNGGLDTSSASYKNRHAAAAPLTALGSGLNNLSHAGKPLKSQAPAEGVGLGPNGLYSSFGGAGLEPFHVAGDGTVRKTKPAAHMTPENWMLEYAKHIHEVNRELAKVRRLNVGQVQVGYGVVERDEDCWVEVEEEIDSDEDEAEADAAALRTATARASPAPGAGLLAPRTLDPARVSPAASPAARSASERPQVANGSPAKRKRTTKVYNPILGVYDPETYVPHVSAATQPSRATLYKVDSVPHLFGEGEEGELGEEEGGDSEDAAARRQAGRERRVLRRWEAAAARRGVASLTYAVDPAARHAPEPLVPGMWDFGAGP